MLSKPRMFAVGSTAVGLIVLILGVVLGWAVIPDIIENRVKEETQLVDTSDTYDKWVKLPVPINLNVYFFHVTNAQELRNDWSVIPKFEEVGPYVFTETREKYDIRNGEDDTISYRQNITYRFNKTLSGKGLDETDKLKLLNLPLIAALTLLDINPRIHPLGYLALDSLLSRKQSLIGEFTVRDVLFKGQTLDPVYFTIENVARLNGIPLPSEISGGTFAFYRGKNATNGEGEWRVYRGVEDSSKFSIIKSVSGGKERLEPWWVDHCAMINGTDGTMFPPFIEESTRLYIYVPEICRSIFMEFEKKVEYEGIPGYRFKIPEALFSGPHIYEPNHCFCMPVAMSPPRNGSCNFSGLGRLFSCKSQVPITIGKPHFLDADDWIVAQAIEFGMSPRREEHDTYLDIEPRTGFPLRVHKRLQVGAELQPLVNFDMAPYNTMPHTIYPVFWADESAELDEPLIDEIKSKLIKPLNLVKIGKWTMVGIGSALFLAGGAFLLYSYFR